MANKHTSKATRNHKLNYREIHTAPQPSVSAAKPHEPTMALVPCRAAAVSQRCWEKPKLAFPEEAGFDFLKWKVCSSLHSELDLEAYTPRTPAAGIEYDG